MRKTGATRLFCWGGEGKHSNVSAVPLPHQLTGSNQFDLLPETTAGNSTFSLLLGPQVETPPSHYPHLPFVNAWVCLSLWALRQKRGHRLQLVTPLEPQPHQRWATVREQGASWGEAAVPTLAWSWVQGTAALCPFMGQPVPGPLLNIQRGGASMMPLPTLNSPTSHSGEQRGTGRQETWTPDSGGRGKGSSTHEGIWAAAHRSLGLQEN